MKEYFESLSKGPSYRRGPTTLIFVSLIVILNFLGIKVVGNIYLGMLLLLVSGAIVLLSIYSHYKYKLKENDRSLKSEMEKINNSSNDKL